MNRKAAIYFAKQAYMLWVTRGVQVPHFGQTSDGPLRQAGATYVYYREGWVVYLKTNGLLFFAQRGIK